MLDMGAGWMHAGNRVPAATDDGPDADDPLHAGMRAAKGLFNVLHPDIARAEADELLASDGGAQQLSRSMAKQRAEDREGVRIQVKAVNDIVTALRPMLRYYRKRNPFEETKEKREEAALRDAADPIRKALLAAFDRVCAVPRDLPDDAARARAVLDYVFDLYGEWIYPEPVIDYQPKDFEHQLACQRERDNVSKMYDLTLVNAQSLQEAQGRAVCEFAYSAREVEIFRQLAATLSLDPTIARKATVYWTRKAIGAVFSSRTLSVLTKAELDLDPRRGWAPDEAYADESIDLAWSALSLWYARGRKRKADRTPEKWAEINKLLNLAGLESKSPATLEATWKSFKADKATELKRAWMAYLQDVVDDGRSREFVNAAVVVGVEEYQLLEDARASAARAHAAGLKTKRRSPRRKKRGGRRTTQ